MIHDSTQWISGSGIHFFALWNVPTIFLCYEFNGLWFYDVTLKSNMLSNKTGSNQTLSFISVVLLYAVAVYCSWQWWRLLLIYFIHRSPHSQIRTEFFMLHSCVAENKGLTTTKRSQHRHTHARARPQCNQHTCFTWHIVSSHF